MSMNHAIKTAMTRHLTAKGYPTDDIRYSLSSCQGDGASFAGELDIVTLAKRLVPQYSEEIWKGLQLDEKLAINRISSCRYVHERSTSLSHDAKCVELTEAHELGGAAQRVAFHGLVQALEADIVDTGSELASMGYKIIEAYPSEEKLIRRFSRRNFRVEVYKFSDERYDIFGEATSTDELDLAIQDVLGGKIEALGLEVRIEMLDDDGEEISTLAMSVFEGFSRDSSISGLCPHSRSLVREAIVEARETYTKLLKPRLRQAA